LIAHRIRSFLGTYERDHELAMQENRQAVSATPSAQFSDALTGVYEVAHPLVRHHVTRLRDESTSPMEFRLHISRLSVLLAYEATSELELEPVDVRTPLATANGHRLKQRIGLVPILRAGLGMVEPLLHLIPEAEVWHLGLYRDERTARPVEYYRKIPDRRPVDMALVLDPMLATGGSAIAALTTLSEYDVPQVKLLSVIASRQGIQEVVANFPRTRMYVCAIDPELNHQKFIVPGLGDAGDRLFNTPDDNDE
jgi:uracil phosphoribosyltransferase